ncbi:MAG: TonB family protein [Paludibacteraceae bacterium]|nr:TonB family protein [Paludibacteraceae bacterium]
MKAGKHTCEVLKSIRKQIADSNGIAYTPSECTFSGECTGTCPNCERERQYLERELSSKLKAGKALKIVGIAAGLSAMVACQEAKGQTTVEENTSIHREFRWDLYPSSFNGMMRTADVELEQMQEMAEFVSEFPNDTFLVESHTDERGSERYKMKLSEVQAKYLRRFFIERGIDPDRVIAIGCGSKEPMVPNAQDEVEHEQNRHYTLEFYSPERLEELENKICSEPSELLSKDSFSQVLEEDSIYAYGVVDERPQFPGGVEALGLYLRNNVRFPASFTDVSSKTRIFVSFVVEKDGSVTNVEISKGAVHPLVDAEAVRVVKAMPKWIPAKHKGRVVRCRYVVPVIFNNDN